MKTIGSQKRELLKDSGMELYRKEGKGAILRDAKTGKLEMWREKDDFAGYVIEIDGKGFEFVRSINE